MGKVTGAVHRNDGPSEAPAAAYVPMAEGSSSEAPVISPRPTERKAPLSGGLGRSALERSAKVGSSLRRSTRTGCCAAINEFTPQIRTAQFDWKRVEKSGLAGCCRPGSRLLSFMIFVRAYSDITF